MGSARKPAVALILAMGLLVLPQSVAAETLVIQSSPITLHRDDPSVRQIGPFHWRGGLLLKSDHRRFGGFSGLIFDPEGDQSFTAISDRGHWLQGRLIWQERRLAAVEAKGLLPLRNERGHRLRFWRARDAEGLARGEEGALYLSLEQRHRVERFAAITGGSAAYAPFSKDLPLEPNRGFEALVRLGSGLLMAISESHLDDDESSFLAFLSPADESGPWRSLRIRTTEGFRPTGATRLPGGEILLLTRRFQYSQGFDARIDLLQEADLVPEAEVTVQPVALLTPPLVTENFEAIAAFRGPAGEDLVAVLSDDNFMPFQSTLMLVFEWMGEGEKE